MINPKKAREKAYLKKRVVFFWYIGILHLSFMMLHIFHMRNLFTLCILFVALVNTVGTAAINIPENISYYEYCYMSSQCDVPEEYQEIIAENILSIKRGQPALY